MNSTKVAVLEAENVQLKRDVAKLSAQVELLTEQLLLIRQQQFGRSSEKTVQLIGVEQISLFNEAEQESDIAAPEPELEQITYKRKKQKGKRELDFSGLPVEQIMHELPESERICPDCGNPLHTCAQDVLRRELTVIPAQYKITEHVQMVYACRDCEEKAERTPMLKAAVPAPVIKGSGVASPSLVAHIAHQKYTLGLPLYRQEQELKRNNINLSRQTMANWLIYVVQHWLSQVYSALKTVLLQSEVIHSDETTVQVLHEDGKSASSESYMWLYRTSGNTDRHVVLFEYRPNRKYETPKNYLEGFKGYLHSDGYGAYHSLPPDIVVSGCWAHVRRKFTDILKSLPDYNKPGSIAMRGKDFCDQLFKLERKFSESFGSSPPTDDDFKRRYKSRLEESKPLMDEFFSWAAASCSNILATPRSATGKALTYALGEREYLENVLLDGRLEISNNRAERSIKPLVIGRKNWLFSNTPKGAEASATLYSIIETAKENGLKPYEYLKYIFETAPNLDLVNCSESVAALLPWNAPVACHSNTQAAVHNAHPWDDAN